MPNNLIAAIDIGSVNNSVAFMDTNGDVITELKKLSNNLPGINKLWDEATKLLREYNLDCVDFVMESTGPYWFGPYWWLKDKCSPFKPSSVTALNSQIVSGFKGKFSHKKQKTDPKDAKAVGNRFRFGQFDPVYVPQGNLLKLRLYTRYRLHVVQSLVAAKSFFLCYLFLKMSEYSRYCKKKGGDDKLFANTFGATSSLVITNYPSAEELANAPFDELSSLISSASKGLIKDPVSRAAIAKGMASDCYPLPEEAKEAVSFILNQTLSLTSFLEERLKIVDDKIGPVLCEIDDPVKTIPGIGTVFAAGIIAEVGDLSRFKAHPHLASYLGIIPSMDDTGQFQSTLNHMTKTGNSYGRYYFIEAANSLRRNNPTFKDYFQRKLAENPKKFKRALGLTARKLIRVYFAIKTKNQQFKTSPMSLEA